MTPADRRAHWGRVHVQADRRAPISISEPTRPHWLPEWEIRKLLAKRRSA